MAKKRHSYDLKKFVRCWQQSSTVPDFLERFGDGRMTPLAASATASRLRKAGVPLKKLYHATRKARDYSELVRLAQ